MSPRAAAARTRIGNGMQDRVGVRVAGQPAGVRDRDPAQYERPTLDQPVRIVTGADASHLDLTSRPGNLRGL